MIKPLSAGAVWSILWFIPIVLLLVSCSPSETPQQAGVGNLAVGGAGTIAGDSGLTGTVIAGADSELVFSEKMRQVLSKALIPGDLSRRIMAAAADGPNFILDLLACLEGDPYLWRLVDKAHALPEGYEPEDLVELTGGAYQINRRGLMLRRAAANALTAMAYAAQAEGVVFLAASSYRSYDYQVEVYARNVREDGQEEADRLSARPGYSQHQTGLVMDFGPIDDSFAKTPAGRWILPNAARFGWSLSFPDGYEAVTGYVWESWHYRYVGPELAAFIDTYFDGIQQYALQFIHQWENTR
ncbi:M15 family metallopeptidase [Treponema primitia]|uniref:M15 family metallopeptidase n=1 Tax=Treponema primitia TaxID=88058 RepID=UPI00025557F0|nr:M15 family metallopeptidase [Treponema primitia]